MKLPELGARGGDGGGRGGDGWGAMACTSGSKRANASRLRSRSVAASNIGSLSGAGTVGLVGLGAAPALC